MKYQPPVGAAGPNDPYIDRNLGTGTQGSRVPAAAIEDPQREIIAVLAAAGLTPSDSVLSQLLDAILILGRGRRAVFSNPGSTTWTVPANVTQIKVRLWGAGGGGGGSTGAGSAGSGAGNGGYAEGTYAVTPGQVLAVSIGAGGVGGIAASPTNGSQGGTTSLASLISSTGGGGGFTGFSAVYTGTVATGGVATGGVPLNINGGYGGYGTAIGSSGIGGTATGDFGRPGGSLSSAAGGPGVFPGGGGGGGANNGNGGAGAGGLIIIEY